MLALSILLKRNVSPFMMTIPWTDRQPVFVLSIVLDTEQKETKKIDNYRKVFNPAGSMDMLLYSIELFPLLNKFILPFFMMFGSQKWSHYLHE